MFSISQIRSLQGAVVSLATAPAADRDGIYQTLATALSVPNRDLEPLRFLPVCSSSAPAVRGLLFCYRDDPAFRIHLTLPDTREAPAALHLDLPKNKQRPSLLGLHYVHGTRRHATTAYYMLSGALAAYEDPAFEYSRLKRKTSSIEQLAEFLYKLNTPVADLPYPKGRKLTIVDLLKKMDVRYVGDLVRKDAAALAAALGNTHWITIQSILRNLRLMPGMPIPQWRAPR